MEWETDRLRAAKQASVDAYYLSAETAEAQDRTAQDRSQALRALFDALQAEAELQTDPRRVGLLQREVALVARSLINADRVSRASEYLAKRARIEATNAEVAASRFSGASVKVP